MQRQMSAERHALDEERKNCALNGWTAKQEALRELEAQFAEMQKRFDENMARVIEA